MTRFLMLCDVTWHDVKGYLTSSNLSPHLTASTVVAKQVEVRDICLRLCSGVASLYPVSAG